MLNIVKKHTHLFVLFVMTGIFSLSAYAQNGDGCKILNPKYSIKKRWNIKASYAMYDTDEIIVRSKSLFGYSYCTNTRLEANYGFSHCLEAGIYGGVQLYVSYKQEYPNLILETAKGVAPVFGGQINFHLLPLFVKNPNARWNLYLTAKYGGMRFLYPEYRGINLKNGKIVVFPERVEYQREYSMGIGGGVYFWNVFGLYAELSLGQFPDYYLKDMEIIKRPYKMRGGISFKF